MVWNDNINMLVVFQDGRFIVWYYFSVVYVDQDILLKIFFEKDFRYLYIYEVRFFIVR